jgi:DNA-binding MarR family transcriptional regulator
MVAARSTAEQGLGFVLNDISRLARKEFDRRVRELRLTRAQWLFLYHLARQPGCTQSELAERLQMQKITVSRQAERLLRAGWIERRDHAEDGRAYHLHVTRKAQPIIARLANVAGRLRDEYLRGLPRPRRAALMADLLHIRTNLLRMDAAAKRRSPSHEKN